MTSRPPDELLAEGGHDDFMTLGELMLLHQITASLKKERESQGLTLAQLSGRAGIDQAALSRLETGSHANPTLDTLYRVAFGLGKKIVCTLQDVSSIPNSVRGMLKWCVGANTLDAPYGLLHQGDAQLVAETKAGTITRVGCRLRQIRKLFNNKGAEYGPDKNRRDMLLRR